MAKAFILYLLIVIFINIASIIVNIIKAGEIVFIVLNSLFIILCLLIIIYILLIIMGEE